MNHRRDYVFLLTFAGALWLASLWLLAQDPLLFKLRRPVGASVLLDGWRQLLVAAAPASAGSTLVLAARRVHAGETLSKESVRRAEVLLFLAGIAAFLLAVTTASRA